MNKIIPIHGDGMSDSRPILICFSHLRWDFVYQRPQHLMERAARTYRVFYIEEPRHEPVGRHFRMRFETSGVTVLTPVFDRNCDAYNEQRCLVADLMRCLPASQVIHWFYTPMAVGFAADLSADVTVYDCMDELSAFRFAPSELPALERDLMARADLVFTGGASLYATKRLLHANVHCFPSSVDTHHFGRALHPIADPWDQAALPQPRIGYFGVIDERMDLDLVARAAADLPKVQFIMVGPVAKVDHGQLPRAQNLHWLGKKDYLDLPAYLANWQAGWMPFAMNDSTRFISPTKTPEFLAAGLPVTSTAVPDVVADWGRSGLVRIADADTIAEALADSLDSPGPTWRGSVERRLAAMSWDGTWNAMQNRIASVMSVMA